MSDRLHPTDAEREALIRRLTWAPRMVAAVLGVSGLLLAVVLLAANGLSLAPTPLSEAAGGALLAAGLPAAFSLLLVQVGRTRARRALAGPLTRSLGRITRVDPPGGDGGPTRLTLELELPDGAAATGHLNTYHYTGPPGAELVLWVSADQHSFFPVELELRCDPGSIRRS